ncbi:MAG TPA: SDR family oxidoreductase [Longimicrobiales bacterium]|nr:SDR family oxidoreductase [Longimicrobiales bacterium]
MDMAGRVALITGGAHRLGRAFALGLAQAGADVVINYRTSADAARATQRDIEALGRRAAVVQADVSRSDDVNRLVAATADTFGRLDILVNSASLFERQPVAEITEADWDRVMAVNLKGPFLLSQAAAPHLRRDDGGVIVNIVDLSALQPWPSYAHHAVSKAGLLHLTRVLARALAPEIRVNAIAPGTVLPPEGTDAEEGSERRVLAREGRPEDVVAALLHLVRSDFVTGENLVVDGGRMLL